MSNLTQFAKYLVANQSSGWILVVGNYESGDSVHRHLSPRDETILDATERFSHYRSCSYDYNGPDRSWYRDGPTSLQTEHSKLENITVYEKPRNAYFAGKIIACWTASALKTYDRFSIID